MKWKRGGFSKRNDWESLLLYFVHKIYKLNVFFLMEWKRREKKKTQDFPNVGIYFSGGLTSKQSLFKSCTKRESQQSQMVPLFAVDWEVQNNVYFGTTILANKKVLIFTPTCQNILNIKRNKITAELICTIMR